MKKLALVMIFIILLVVSNVCAAMSISQPVNIGGIRTGQVAEFKFNGELANNWQSRSSVGGQNSNAYTKGVAVFGNSGKKLYFHYQIHPSITRYGDSDLGNTIDIDTGFTKIYQLDTTENITLYVIDSCCSEFHDGINYTLIGRRQDGRFVKYLDTDSLFKRYYGKKTTNGVSYVIDSVKAQGGSVVFLVCSYDYNDYFGKGKFSPIKVGEFRCKWDNNAQWFSVESILY